MTKFHYHMTVSWCVGYNTLHVLLKISLVGFKTTEKSVPIGNGEYTNKTLFLAPMLNSEIY